MKAINGFFSIVLFSILSLGLAIGADAPPGDLNATNMGGGPADFNNSNGPTQEALMIFDHISEYSDIQVFERPKSTADFGEAQQVMGTPNLNDGGSDELLSNSVTQFYDFRNYWSGYYYSEGDVSFSPYMYSNWSYSYNWQPTTFSLPEPATSITMNVYDYLYYYNYYGAILIAYDESGSYLGQVSSNHYGWNNVTYNAPAGTKIGYFVLQHKYYSNYSWYLQYMWITYENNQDPVAEAGADQSFDCVITSQDVVLDGSGSSDPDLDALTYSWSGAFGTASGVNPTVSLGGGSHTITLTVDDGNGGLASDDLTVTVVLDTDAPELEAPADLMVYANTAGGFSGAIGDAIAVDACDPTPVVSSDAPALFLLGDTEVTYTAVDAAGNSSTGTQTVTVEPFPVTVDIKPGSDNNSVNPKSRGVIPVAILSEAGFDATTIDVSSLSFGPGGAATAHSGHIEDVDDDGDDDLMLHFRTQASGVSSGDVALCLTGFTLSGIPLAGCDGINGNSLGKSTSSGSDDLLPSSLSLEQNYPNPFNPSTVIGYSLPEAGNVSLVVYNMRGAVIATLVNDYKNAGSYQVEFDGAAFSSGTYLYVLNTNGVRSIKRFSLMK
ncbi:MAG: T9SS type A sorting domain-containing protein [FCB group bacterium]|nr:T9SS type A sorting domain-containing protein [FCB group bacterium]